MPDRSPPGRGDEPAGVAPAGPRWRALEIGPGGLPPEQVRPMGPGAPWAGPPSSAPLVLQMQPLAQGAVDPWSPVPAPPPPRSRRVVGFVVLGAVVVLLVVLALWSNNSPSGAAEVTAGDCLAQEDSGDYRVADCGSAAASLRVTASLAATAAARDCDDVPADGALLTDDAVLCLDFLLTRGDCVQLTGPDLGRTDCPAPGQSANGILRVLDVLPDTQDTGSCPGTTEQILLHPASREVVCLGAA